MTFVNRLHNLLCPPYSIGYGSYGSRNPRSTVVLRQFSSRQNRGGDQQHALATLVHFRSLALSPYVRYIAKSLKWRVLEDRSPRHRSRDDNALSTWSQKVPAPLKKPSRPEPCPAAKSPHNRLPDGILVQSPARENSWLTWLVLSSSCERNVIGRRERSSNWMRRLPRSPGSLGK
jgi:hypothetical protein